jgi:hypothetical protein
MFQEEGVLLTSTIAVKQWAFWQSLEIPASVLLSPKRVLIPLRSEPSLNHYSRLSLADTSSWSGWTQSIQPHNFLISSDCAF